MSITLKSLNVLLVEDELEIQKHLKEVLEYFFANVFVANDGLEALKVLKSNLIHVIFTDYEMPHLNGYELIKEIRSFNKKIPITVVSNHSDTEKLQACIPLGLSGYLIKPLSYKKLKNYLEKLTKDMMENGSIEYDFSSKHKFLFATNILLEEEKQHQLTKLEASFLQLLISLDGKVATFDYIEEYLFDYDLSEGTIKNLIYRLKTKYNFDYIKNIKEVGYILVTHD